MIVTNCLVKFRKENNMTRQQMSEKIGVSKSLYEKIELYDRLPSREFMEKFKRTFPTSDMNIFFDELLHT